MTEETFAQRRPFPLQVQHQVDEPAHALLIRSVAHNGSRKFGTVLRRCGVPSNHIVAKVDIGLVAHLCGANVEALLYASALRVDGGINVLGQRLRAEYFGDMWRRWCPHCLSEHPYHRSWWDVLVVGSCPFHGVQLVERCECDKPLRHGEHAPTHCRIGHDLRTVPSPQVAAEDSVVDRYVVHRLLRTGAFPHHMLDLTTLGRALHIIERIGRSQLAEGMSVEEARKRHGTSAMMLIGYRALDDFPKNFHRLLDVLVARRTEADLTSVLRAYGDLRYWLGIVPGVQEDCALAAALRAEVDAHAVANTIVATRIISEGKPVEGIRAGVLAQDLELPSYVVHRLAVAMGMKLVEHPSLGPLFSPDQAAELRARYAKLESMEDLIQALGVRRNVVIELADLGYLEYLCRPFVRLKEPKGKRGQARQGRLRDADWNTWYFHAGTAKALLARFHRLVEERAPGEDDRFVELFWVTRMFVPIAEVVRLALSGELPIRRIDPSTPGLRGIMVLWKEAQQVLKLARRQGHPLRQAAPLLGLNYNQLCSCIKVGILVPDGAGTRLSIDDEQIEKFKARYVRTAEIGSLIGCSSPRVVIRHLLEHGVEPIKVDGEIGVTLFYREQAMAVARSAPPPASFKNSRQRVKHQLAMGLPLEPGWTNAPPGQRKVRSNDRSGRRRPSHSSSIDDTSS